MEETKIAAWQAATGTVEGGLCFYEAIIATNRERHNLSESENV